MANTAAGNQGVMSGLEGYLSNWDGRVVPNHCLKDRHTFINLPCAPQLTYAISAVKNLLFVIHALWVHELQITITLFYNFTKMGDFLRLCENHTKKTKETKKQ